MTAPTLPSRTEARPSDGRPRRVDLALARAHLRLGSLALARTELETLAGMGALDAPGLVDLAEVRWRTGDLPGAGEAAVVALDAGADDPMALLIAAEAASADGRPSEARRLAGLAMAELDGRIDRVFAGMPRSAVWPPDAAEPPPTAATLFHREVDEDTIAGSSRRAASGAPAGQAVVTPEPAADEPGEGEEGPGAGPLTLGFWDADSGQSSAAHLPDPDDAFQAGRAALIAGAFDEAAFRFSLAIRFAPALAPAVLEATDGARSVPLIMVRGDAFRLVGHESEARQAYTLAALGGPPERRRRPRTGSGPERRMGGGATLLPTEDPEAGGGGGVTSDAAVTAVAGASPDGGADHVGSTEPTVAGAGGTADQDGPAAEVGDPEPTVVGAGGTAAQDDPAAEVGVPEPTVADAGEIGAPDARATEPAEPLDTADAPDSPAEDGAAG